MNSFDLDGVYPLHYAENDLLQVLLSEFHLYRVDDSAHLDISFEENSPSIRRREAKQTVNKEMPNFKHRAEKIQRILEGLLIKGEPTEYHHQAEDFVFRYANGGVLPIVELGGEEYYCLFYRDMPPIGWNIANGASDTIEELLNPVTTIERELCEELIVLDLANRTDYIFSLGDDRTVVRPEFDAARKLWDSFFVEHDIRRFKRSRLKIDWEQGNDQITITYGNQEPQTVTGGFLNINAEDFGIEFDKIAHLKIDENALLLDGEIYGNKLLNRPVGLFKVSRFAGDFDKSAKFQPDHLFWGPQKFQPQQLDLVLKRYFFPRLVRQKIRTQEAVDNYFKDKNSPKIGLCPVTRQIIMRHQLRHGERREPSQQEKASQAESLEVPQAFVSYSHKDQDQVQKLVRHLRAHGIKVWIDETGIRPGERFREKINNALKDASHLLFLVTKNSSDSDEVWMEVDAAAGRMPVVPLMFEEVDLRYDFKTVQFISFSDFNLGLSALMEYLLGAGRSAK